MYITSPQHNHRPTRPYSTCRGVCCQEPRGICLEENLFFFPLFPLTNDPGQTKGPDGWFVTKNYSHPVLSSLYVCSRLGPSLILISLM